MRKADDMKIRSIAEELRKRLNLETLAAPDLATVLIKMTEKYPGFSFAPKLESEMGTDEAWFNSSTKTLNYKETILNEASMGKGRPRFTLAHELGHFMLEHSGNPRRNPDKAIYLTPKDRIQECEADIFASYFLVPSYLAANASSPQDIEARFQVSSIVAEIAYKRVQKEKRLASGETRRPPQMVIDFLKESEKRGYKVQSRIEFDE